MRGGGESSDAGEAQLDFLSTRDTSADPRQQTQEHTGGGAGAQQPRHEVSGPASERITRSPG